MEKKEGRRGAETASNAAGNGSAVTRAPSGYIQGYIGMAVCGQKEQVIVSAQAAGSANEGEHFPRIVDTAAKNVWGIKRNIPGGRGAGRC